MAVSRRITGKTQILQLKVQLRNVRPPIWRRLLVPGDMTLHEAFLAPGQAQARRAIQAPKSPPPPIAERPTDELPTVGPGP